MNELPFSPDDPRLTAFALGELEGDERVAIDAALRASPELRRIVDEIRQTARELETALAAEELPAVAEPPAANVDGTPAHRPLTDEVAPTVAAASTQTRPRDIYRDRTRLGKLVRFPQFYYIAGGLAAAGFAVLVALHRDDFALREQARADALRVAMQERAESERLRANGGRMLVQLPVGPAESSVPADAASATSVPSEARPAVPVTDLSLLSQAREEAATLGTVGGAGALASSGAAFSVGAAEPAPAASAARKVGTVILASSGPATERVANAVSGIAADGRLQRTQPPVPPRETVTLSAFEVSSAPSGGRVDLYSGPRTRPPEFGPPPAPPVTHNTEAYSFIRDNGFLSAAGNPLSTFSIDVDTASYSNLRRFLTSRQLPPPDAVRIEELLNYFPYRYRGPQNEEPFAASLEVAAAPWTSGHRLVRIGLKGREIAAEARPAANLVFLLDVSGSMNAANKLPLVQESMRLLLGKLRPDDRVAIVTYAGNSGLALPSTPVSRSREILAAIDSLRSGGSTHGAMGIQLAYDVAKANFASGGVNRVILCTDGDFNVGMTSQGELVRLIEEKARSQVFLTVLGFGMGNLKDGTLEQLADKGNGQYGYIDTRREAEKLLVEELTGTLVTIAKDVKIQVEFNPARVASYRLIGYENRVLAKEDFNNDQVDAGEIGSGHTVTALYEIVPVDAAPGPVVASVDDLKYQTPATRVPGGAAAREPKWNELLTVKVRYKEPTGDVSRKLEFPLTDSGATFAAASADFRFAAAVAQFGMILRKSEHRGTATLGSVLAWAAEAAATPADDPRGYRAEFIDLIRQAQELMRTE